jgi:hypothetical protein
MNHHQVLLFPVSEVLEQMLGLGGDDSGAGQWQGQDPPGQQQGQWGDRGLAAGGKAAVGQKTLGDSRLEGENGGGGSGCCCCGGSVSVDCKINMLRAMEVSVTCLVAALSTDFAKFSDFVGAFMVPVVGFILPAVLHIKVFSCSSTEPGVKTGAGHANSLWNVPHLFHDIFLILLGGGILGFAIFDMFV